MYLFWLLDQRAEEFILLAMFLDGKECRWEICNRGSYAPASRGLQSKWLDFVIHDVVLWGGGHLEIHLYFEWQLFSMTT